MVSLITGVSGMIGSHLAEHLLKKKNTTIGLYYNSPATMPKLAGNISLIECDIRYFHHLYNVILEYLPERIFHLAAQSLPTVSIIRPQETMDINITGTINIFESIKLIKKKNPSYTPIVIVACSSAEYGTSFEFENIPIKENAPLLPLHPYGISKVAQDLITYQYYKSDGLNGIRARIFNTTGPRKTNDVCADFTKRVVEIEKGFARKLRVGNLSTKRAIIDVRDLVVALDLLSENGLSGEAYNISGEKVYQILDIIEIIKKNALVKIEVEVDKKLLRPTDEPIIFGDSSKLKSATGWKPKYSLERTISDMLEYWRMILR